MSEEIKKGLLGIVVDETTISHVVPELSALTYRGYTVQELCDKCDFEEVAYLVLNGELPNKSQLKKFIKQERSERKLSKQILNDIKKKLDIFSGSEKGIDVIIDINGLQKKQNLLKCLKWRGKYLIIGFVDGNITNIRTNYILMKGLRIYGVRAGEYLRKNVKKKAIIIKNLKTLCNPAKVIIKAAPLPMASDSLSPTIIFPNHKLIKSLFELIGSFMLLGTLPKAA